MSSHQFTRFEPLPPPRPLAARFREIRIEQFGLHGLPELARQVGVSAGEWASFENDVVAPLEVVMAFLEITRCSPPWLLTGTGPKYRQRIAGAERMPRIYRR